MACSTTSCTALSASRRRWRRAPARRRATWQTARALRASCRRRRRRGRREAAQAPAQVWGRGRVAGVAEAAGRRLRKPRPGSSSKSGKTCSSTSDIGRYVLAHGTGCGGAGTGAGAGCRRRRGHRRRRGLSNDFGAGAGAGAGDCRARARKEGGVPLRFLSGDVKPRIIIHRHERKPPVLHGQALHDRERLRVSSFSRSRSARGRRRRREPAAKDPAGTAAHHARIPMAPRTRTGDGIGPCAPLSAGGGGAAPGPATAAARATPTAEAPALATAAATARPRAAAAAAARARRVVAQAPTPAESQMVTNPRMSPGRRLCCRWRRGRGSRGRGRRWQGCR